MIIEMSEGYNRMHVKIVMKNIHIDLNCIF